MNHSQVVWSKICHHLDGIAIGSSVYALARRGLFDRLAAARSPLLVSALAEELGARPGYFHLAIRLLASQGFVRRCGDIPNGEVSVGLTEAGHSWLSYLHAYERVPDLIGFAFATPDLIGEAAASVSSLGLDDSELGQRVTRHVRGHLLAPAMKELAVQEMEKADGASLRERVRELSELLRLEDWARRGPGGVELTPEGEVAVKAASQYFYPVSYLPTNCAVPEMLFGAQPFAPAGDVESHVDRSLDIAFSGLVFERSCKQPFLDIALPLFDREPVADQPVGIVDTGSGDGTLLLQLYQAIRDRTRRGTCLDQQPLTMVGAEYNEIARRATAERLQHAGVPHLAVFGDIGDPGGLAATLSEAGLDPHDVLHVSKSVVHNRTFRHAEGRTEWQPSSTAVFVAPDGALIGAADLERNLIEHFEAWRPWTARHGMIVIEAHTVDPEVVAASTSDTTSLPAWTRRTATHISTWSKSRCIVAPRGRPATSLPPITRSAAGWSAVRSCRSTISDPRSR